jgi:hypothetical protein
MKPLIARRRKRGQEIVYYQISVHWHPWIDPEDLRLAFAARLEQSLKRRERISEKVLIEDWFIDSLVNN